jgi:glycosyltransferase involved in cell wall biosynthesis
MHVAFAHHEPINAGKARWVAMLRTLAAVAQHQQVSWFTPDTADRITDYARSHLGLTLPTQLQVRTLPSVRKLAGLTINHVFFRACRKAVEKSGADVLWLRSDKLAAHFARKPAGPLVYEAHLIGPLWALDRGAGQRRAARLERIERELYAGTSAVAAITQGLLDEVRSRYGFAGLAEVVPSAVDTDLFKPVWRGGDGCTIAYVGTLQFWKGLETLLEALALAPRLRLLVVGGGSADDKQQLRSRIEQLGLGERVEFAGHRPQPQIPALVGKCACAVHPLPPNHAISARFTSPLKLFEYMAMGLPIVAADVPSVREVMRDGANARLYQAGDAASLAAALLEVAGDSKLARRLSMQAIADAGRFTYAARAERLIGLFKAGIGVP